MLSALPHPIAFRLDHRFTVRHASALLDGDLSPAQEARAQRHASACPMCRDLLNGLRRTIGGLAQLRAQRGGGASDGEVAPSIIAALRDAAGDLPTDPSADGPPHPPPETS